MFKQDYTTCLQRYLLPYIGGKCLIAPRFIHPEIPTNIKTYVEPFGGMGWSLLKLDLEKFQSLETIVYNDQNPLNVNLFLCAKKYNVFAELLILNKPECGDRETFLEYRKEIFSPNFNHRLDGNNPDYETAFKYVYIMNHTYNGYNPERASFCHKEPGQHSKFNSLINKLRNNKMQSHLDKLSVIAHGDYKEIINEFDSKDTFIYLDPPYLNREHFYSLNDFNVKSHYELATKLHGVQGRFALSYYYFDQLLDWYPATKYRWIYKDVHKPSANNGSTGREYLIMNY